MEQLLEQPDTGFLTDRTVIMHRVVASPSNQIKLGLHRAWNDRLEGRIVDAG
ncbi:Uncharacterised protein [Mycobacteroides abscessus subsp. abscessus]|nr:Uncharacterised protein [Mycobacteroides abscessus subsp. abscessus]